MTKDRVLLGRVLLSLVVGLGCTPEGAQVTATPTVGPTLPAPTTAAPTPARTTAPGPPSFAVVPTVSPDPASPASGACPTLTGGSALAAPRVVAVRAAHNPGFDRLVIELTEQVVPLYEIKASSSVFSSTSGFSLRVDGNAFFSVRVAGQARTDAGQRSYPQADPYRPGLPLIR